MKKILKIIIWQDFEKPSSKGYWAVSIINWIVALCFIIMFSVIIYYSNMHNGLKILLLAYIIPNILLWAPVKIYP